MTSRKKCCSFRVKATVWVNGDNVGRSENLTLGENELAAAAGPTLKKFQFIQVCKLIRDWLNSLTHWLLAQLTNLSHDYESSTAHDFSIFSTGSGKKKVFRIKKNNNPTVKSLILALDNTLSSLKNKSSKKRKSSTHAGYSPANTLKAVPDTASALFNGGAGGFPRKQTRAQMLQSPARKAQKQRRAGMLYSPGHKSSWGHSQESGTITPPKTAGRSSMAG